MSTTLGWRERRPGGSAICPARWTQNKVCDKFLTFGRVIGDSGHDLDKERGEQGAVLAAAEADQPGAGVVQIKAAEGTLDVAVTAAAHWGEHSADSAQVKRQFVGGPRHGPRFFGFISASQS